MSGESGGRGVEGAGKQEKQRQSIRSRSKTMQSFAFKVCPSPGFRVWLFGMSEAAPPLVSGPLSPLPYKTDPPPLTHDDSSFFQSEMGHQLLLIL